MAIPGRYGITTNTGTGALTLSAPADTNRPLPPDGTHWYHIMRYPTVSNRDSTLWEEGKGVFAGGVLTRTAANVTMALVPGGNPVEQSGVLANLPSGDAYVVALVEPRLRGQTGGRISINADGEIIFDDAGLGGSVSTLNVAGVATIGGSLTANMGASLNGTVQVNGVNVTECIANIPPVGGIYHGLQAGSALMSALVPYFTQDVLRLRLPSLVQTRTGSTWTTLSNEVAAPIVADYTAGGLTSLFVDSSVEEIILSWAGIFAYVLPDWFMVSHGTYGNEWTYYLETSSDNTNWTTNYSTGGVQDWPGNLVMRVSGLSTASKSFRVRVKRTLIATGNGFDIFGMKLLTGYPNKSEVVPLKFTSAQTALLPNGLAVNANSNNGHALYVSGTAHVVAGVTTGSSAALKTNWQAIPHAVTDAFLDGEVKPRYWEYIEDPGNKHVGYSAEYFHEVTGLGTACAISGEAPGFMAMATVVRLNERLTAQIEELETKLNTLQEQVNALN